MLELRGVVRGYRGRPPRRVLQGVDLRLPAGSVAALSGANGAGKTTLLRVAAGQLAPERGEVVLDGVGPRVGAPFRQRVGLLPAGGGGLYARLDVRAHLHLFAALALLPAARRREAIASVIERLDLGELLDRRVDRLSTGQRQRVRLATAVVHGPSVLLLDEPHASLDDEALGLLARMLREHASSGGAALWLAPDARRADLPADTVFVLRDGLVHPA